MCNDKKIIVVILLTTILIFITVMTANKLREQSELAAAAENAAVTEYTRTSDPVTKHKYKNSGVVSENGRDVLHIHDYAYDGNYGGSGYTILENDGIFSIEYLGGCGWNLIPQKSGHYKMAVDEYWATSYLGSIIYDVTADENLKISYAERDVSHCLCYSHGYFSFSTEVTVQTGDNSIVLSQFKYQKLLEEMENLYGCDKLYSTDPDLSEYTKVISVHKVYGYNVISEFYVSKDKIYYQHPDDKTEQWHEFIPDELFSLDKINELLDLKD